MPYEKSIEFWRNWYRVPVTQRLQQEIITLQENNEGVNQNSAIQDVLDIKKGHLNRIRVSTYKYPEEAKKRW